MNTGLIRKSLREVWLMTLLCGVALAAFEAFLAYIFPTFTTGAAAQMLQMKFVQNIISGLLGTELGNSLNATTLNSFAWVHPLTFIIVWTHAITYWTRMPAGEIDRGSIDLLLSLPVSRSRVYLSETVVWLCAGMLIMLMGLAGNLFGGLFIPPEQRVAPARLLIVVVNLFCLYASVGGMVSFVSAWCNRRGRAVGIAFGVVLTWFLMNFLAQFWPPAERVAFLSVVHYYRPLTILRDAAWPFTDMLILSATGLLFWGAGAIVFSRRDICTV